MTVDLNLTFLEGYADPYLLTEAGKGVFLSGVVLGILASQQSKDITSAPLFKQINFGRMQMRDLKGFLARVQGLAKAYQVENFGRISMLAGAAQDRLLKDGSADLGIDGNFVFASAFVNAWKYYKMIFPKSGEENEKE